MVLMKNVNTSLCRVVFGESALQQGRDMEMCVSDSEE